MSHVLVRSKVQDFAKWKVKYDEHLMSRLFKNVPILNSLKMSPLLMLSMACALKRSPVPSRKSIMLSGRVNDN
jgi:hypothetical protein